MPPPELHSPTDEIRRLMRADWGDITQGSTPLVDTDRAARLYGIVADPYHRLALAGRSKIIFHLADDYVGLTGDKLPDVRIAPDVRGSKSRLPDKLDCDPAPEFLCEP